MTLETTLFCLLFSYATPGGVVTKTKKEEQGTVRPCEKAIIVIDLFLHSTISLLDHVQ